MTLQQGYFITEIVVGIAVIVAISFVALELRQNSYLLRKSMADQRNQRLSWLFETLCTDNDFRQFHRRIEADWEIFNKDEKYRAHCLGVRSLRSMLDELVAYYDGQISEDEWHSLEFNMNFAAKRPNFASSYAFLRDSYPRRVQTYWESLPTSPTSDGASFHELHKKVSIAAACR